MPLRCQRPSRWGRTAGTAYSISARPQRFSASLFPFSGGCVVRTAALALWFGDEEDAARRLREDVPYGAAERRAAHVEAPHPRCADHDELDVFVLDQLDDGLAGIPRVDRVRMHLEPEPVGDRLR